MNKMKTKKTLFSLLLCVMLMSCALGVNAVVHAQDQQPISTLDQIVGGKSGLTNFAGRFSQLSSTAPGADAITSIIFFAIDFLKYLIGAIAVVYVIVSGIKLIVSGKKVDEVSEKEKENLKYIIYGLILIITADELVTKVFFGDYGECLASASNAKDCAHVGGTLIQGIYGLVLAVLASVSIFILVLAAFRMVTAYGNEETITKEKKRIVMAVVGLLVAGIGEFVVKGIVFPENGTKGIDAAAAQNLVANFTNFIAAFIGVGAFLMFFYGGYLYVVSAGNEEQTGKAKKIMVGAVIGIVIALGAFGIVATVTTLNSGRQLNLPGALPGLPGK